MSKGVAILIQRNFPIEIEAIKVDTQGRYIIVDFVIDKFKGILVNVYGPNEDNPSFFTNLFDKIDARYNDSLLMAGDFNIVMDPRLDLYNNRGSIYTQKRKVLQEYLEQKGLVDVFRVMHPDEQIYTWRKPFGREIIMSRLDYFFVSQDLLLRTNQSIINTRFSSDHSRISLQIDFSTNKRGPGSWKFNNLLLQDKEFLSNMNDLIVQYKYNVKPKHEGDLDVQWEELTRLMIQYAKKYAKEKAKQKNMLIEKMENRILLLDRKILSTTDTQLKNKYIQDV